MKVTTTLRDNGKVNQIVPIMQEHLGSVMNLARIKLLAFVLQALCVVQTVSLHKIASAMPTCVERDSNLRRLQRFLAGYALNLDLIAKVIFALLPVKTGLVPWPWLRLTRLLYRREPRGYLHSPRAFLTYAPGFQSVRGFPLQGHLSCIRPE